MTEQRTVNLSDLMNGAVFKQGRDDVGKSWPPDYDRWSEFRQVSYELGRQFGAVFGKRDFPKGHAEAAMMQQLQSGSILG